jgi:trimeric autotransporter adhesin
MIHRPSFVSAGALALASAASVEAIVTRDASRLLEKTFRHPGLQIDNLERPAGAVESPRREVLARQLYGLGAQSGLHDWRSGGWGSLVLSVPLLPGDGAGNPLGPPRAVGETEAWRALTGYLSAHRDSLRIDHSELGAPRVSVFDSGALVLVHAPRVVGGVLVRDSGLSAVVNHGNLILLGIRAWGDVGAPSQPAITAEAARQVVAGHVRPFVIAGYRGEATLERIPLARGQDVATTVEGRGYDYRLAWVVAALVLGDPGSWEGLVDAVTGELIAFQDTNAYAARRVVGGVYPLSSDQQPPDGFERPGWPMPFADVTGTAATFTTTGGLVTACERGALQTTLDGRFVRITEGCGPVNEQSAAGDIDLGVSAGTDCVVPPGHSPGDTHAARTAFYQLNRMKEQARGHVTADPGAAWLDGVLQAAVNDPLTCNFFWNGTKITTGRDNGGPCRNGAEIAGVLDHEFGHGLDDNDTNGSLSQPAEGAADVFANLRHNRSCVGRGVLKSMVCGGYGDECDGIPPTGCTGVRDHDFMLHRCDRPHTVSWITQGFTSPECNNTGPAPACPPSGGGAPCGRASGCEGMVVGETVWDLQFRDLRAAPFDFDASTALELATRLHYRASQLITDWYACSVGGGCGATTGYMQYLAADDDNGNIGDGTPHMSAIRAAFERHEIHCPTPAVLDSGCAGGPALAPAVTATPIAGGADLAWGAVPGAATYAVYRTEGLDCDRGKTRIGETAGTGFSDSGLLDGRTYFYGVLAIGSNPSCLGPMSPCASAVPLLPSDPCVPVELQGFAVE